MSSSSYLSDVLNKCSIDICGISEHWLYEKDLYFLECIDKSYKSHAVCDSSLNLPSTRRVGKGGVAIFWHKRLDCYVSPLLIEEDRIVGVQLELFPYEYIFIFQVYLPCSNHSITDYRESIEKLNNYLSFYSVRGTVIIMGDFNANLNSDRHRGPFNARSKDLYSFLNINNYIATNTLDICKGATSTFVSYDGQCETLIDHFLIPIEKLDMINDCIILDDDTLNVSRHRPIFCSLTYPRFYLSDMNISSNHINWKRVNTEMINQYQTELANDSSLHSILSAENIDGHFIDASYYTITESLRTASEKCFPKTSFKKYLKPYWNDDLKILHKNMTHKRSNWITAGRPRDSSNTFYKEYKDAKRVFRRLHRQTVDSYCVQMHEDIDKLADVDSGLFWREINKRRKKSSSDPGSEINFNGNNVREPQLIATEWGNYFQELYTPDENNNRDLPFENEMRNELQLALNSSSIDDCTDNNISSDEINEALRECKKGKACGEDLIFYEHVIYGGHYIREALAVLYSAMYSLTYAPVEMKRGTIITLHKGGRKRKDDPNNYRAITLSSVLLKIYERILLHRLESNFTERLDKLQGGFQKHIGCLMTSFSVKEAISFCKENNSKLYACFLDVRKAFDTVWHLGMFYKLLKFNVRGLMLKAIINLYDKMESRVKFKGFTSDWFPVLQGTRQGGVLSPVLYLVTINDLILELKASMEGLTVYNMILSSPTVADDMLLLSLTKIGLSIMMQICHRYSLKWHFGYQAVKCFIVVYNESEAEYKRCHVNREWFLGTEKVQEATEYKHLGVILDKHMSLSANVKESSSKLKTTLLSLVNSGINETGFHPITSLHLYKSVVLPKGLYGAELWNSLTPSQEEALERAHRFCVKFIQGLPKQTRSDIALGILGANPIMAEIDKKKLIFFGQLCRLSPEVIHNQILNHRLFSVFQTPGPKYGFVPDILRILDKYSLSYVLDEYMQTGRFMTKFSWNRLVRTTIDEKVKDLWKHRITSDITLQPFLGIHDKFEPCAIWVMCKNNYKYKKFCQAALKILSLLFHRGGIIFCKVCGQCYSCSPSEHIVLYCRNNENIRMKLWKDLSERFGCNFYLWFISLSPFNQVIALLSSFENTLVDENDKLSAMRIVIFSLFKMLYSC